MRQRDQERVAGQTGGSMGLTDQLVQWSRRKEPFERESPNRDDHARPNDPQLRLQPLGAVLPPGWRRNAVAASTRARSREAACNRRDVDAAPRFLFVDPGLGEPAKERSTSATGEGSSPAGLDLSRGLPDDYDPRRNREGQDRGDVGGQPAPATSSQLRPMMVESRGFRGR